MPRPACMHARTHARSTQKGPALAKTSTHLRIQEQNRDARETNGLTATEGNNNATTATTTTTSSEQQLAACSCVICACSSPTSMVSSAASDPGGTWRSTSSRSCNLRDKSANLT